MSEKLSLKNTRTIRGSEDREGFFEVLYPGKVFGNGINRKALKSQTIVPPKSDNPTAQDWYDPSLCIVTHIEREELSEGIEVRTVQCPNKAVEHHSHSWLCKEHLEEVTGSVSQLRHRAEMQVINDILTTDRNAIKAGTLTKVQVTKEFALTYLT